MVVGAPGPQRANGTKRLNHPLVGELDVQFETLTVSGEPSQALYLYTAEPGTASDQALALLASWTQTNTAGAPSQTKRGMPDM